tara:strand:+ start:159 stop:521 length:363 start_codon:yes stop_codon:yes gene_type:complete
MDKLEQALEAYSLGLLAKDLTSRYPNPNRVLRSIETIREATVQSVSKDDILKQMKSIMDAKPTMAAPVAEAIARQAAPAQAKVDHSKLDKKEFYQFKNQVFDKLDQLIKKTSAPVEVATE